MDFAPPKRRPRFRRADAPPAFRLTDGDVEILRLLARHRFLRSTHIAVLVGRSLDRTNDRLCRLFHAGYVDRPRAQLDYYPTAGSAPMVYALGDGGVRFLAELDGVDFGNPAWSRKNRQAGRPFIEHQLEIVDFYVALQLAARDRRDLRLLPPEELIAAFPEETRAARNPLSLRATISHGGTEHKFGLVPDLAFGLMFPDGSRRCFLVEIDRGTMPITRSDIRQTSFARKMRGYLNAHDAGEHTRRFGWRTFRVLTVTTDEQRILSMIETAQTIHSPTGFGTSLFLFATGDDLRSSDPLAHSWKDGLGHERSLT